MSLISQTCQDAAENGTLVGVLKTKTLQGKKLKVKFEFLYFLGHSVINWEISLVVTFVASSTKTGTFRRSGVK